MTAEESEFGDVPEPVEITIYIIVSLAIISTNCLTIVAVATRRKLRTIPNMYVSSLAVADALIGLYLMLKVLAKVPAWEEGLEGSLWWCLITGSMIFVLVALSTLSMLIIAIDRFLCIQFPLHYNMLITKTRAVLIIALSWIIATIYGVVPMYASDHDEFLEVGCEPTHVFPKAYMIGVHPAMFCSISVASVVLYGIIMKNVMRQRRLIHAQEQAAAPDGKEQRQRRHNNSAAKMLFLVFGLFFLCWFPMLVVTILEYTVHISHLYLTICSALVASHSAMNFGVYAAVNKDFGIAFQRMLCPRRLHTVETESTIPSLN